MFTDKSNKIVTASSAHQGGLGNPEIERGNKLGQPLGEESKANLKRLIDEARGKVIVVIHESDRVGRDVSEVFNSPTSDKDNELFLNGQQVLDGMAYDYKRFSSRCMNGESLEVAEEIAKAKRVGVWNGKRYELPWDFRKAQK